MYWKSKDSSRVIIKPRLRPKPWSFKEHLSAKEKGRKKTKKNKKKTRRNQEETKRKSKPRLFQGISLLALIFLAILEA